MRLGVNIDHVATLRQARRGRLPDPVEAALICEQGGADSIVCHLREDRRHIHDRDVRRLKQAVRRLNLEMSIAPDIVRVALAIRPAQVTLVPERREELTTEGGLNVLRLSRRLAPLIRAFHARRIQVSLFVDPLAGHLKAAKAMGAAVVELHTGRYANAKTPAARRRELDALKRAASLGKRFGLAVAAGHGLDYENVSSIAEIPEIEEMNIGYAIIVRALSVGLEGAVCEMADLIHGRAAHALQTA